MCSCLRRCSRSQWEREALQREQQLAARLEAAEVDLAEARQHEVDLKLQVDNLLERLQLGSPELRQLQLQVEELQNRLDFALANAEAATTSCAAMGTALLEHEATEKELARHAGQQNFKVSSLQEQLRHLRQDHFACQLEVAQKEGEDLLGELVTGEKIKHVALGQDAITIQCGDDGSVGVAASLEKMKRRIDRLQQYPDEIDLAPYLTPQKQRPAHFALNPRDATHQLLPQAVGAKHQLVDVQMTPLPGRLDDACTPPCKWITTTPRAAQTPLKEPASEHSRPRGRSEQNVAY